MGKQNVQAEKVYKTIKWTLLLNKHNVSFIDIMTDLLLIVMNKEPFKFWPLEPCARQVYNPESFATSPFTDNLVLNTVILSSESAFNCLLSLNQLMTDTFILIMHWSCKVWPSSYFSEEAVTFITSWFPRIHMNTITYEQHIHWFFFHKFINWWKSE